jgi:hypothetical protein
VQYRYPRGDLLIPPARGFSMQLISAAKSRTYCVEVTHTLELELSKSMREESANMAIRDAVCFPSGKALLSAIDECGQVKNLEVTHTLELKV